MPPQGCTHRVASGAEPQLPPQLIAIVLPYDQVTGRQPTPACPAFSDHPGAPSHHLWAPPSAEISLPPTCLCSQGGGNRAQVPAPLRSPKSPKIHSVFLTPGSPHHIAQPEAEDWGHTTQSKCEAHPCLLPRLETPGSAPALFHGPKTLEQSSAHLTSLAPAHPVTKFNGIYTGHSTAQQRSSQQNLGSPPSGPTGMLRARGVQWGDHWGLWRQRGWGVRSPA